MPVFIQADDLAIQHRMLSSQEQLERGAQVSEAGEAVTVARNQPDARGVEMSQRPEAVVLRANQDRRTAQDGGLEARAGKPAAARKTV